MRREGTIPPPERGYDRVQLARERLAGFVETVFRRAGVRPADARIAADVLVLSDVRGIASHGVARLPAYVSNLRSGAVNPRPETRVLERRSATELWDADNGLGHPVSHRAMRRAIVVARRSGVGLVTIRESSHFGIAGAYVKQAMAAKMIGIALTNADPNVAATGSTASAFGTNPIAIGAAGHRHAYLLDMATSVVPAGRLEVARRRGKPIPEGWAVEAGGGPSRDPAVLERGGYLLPLGGASTELGGYKGFGLAAAVDLLSGVLPDTAWSLSVRSMYPKGDPVRVGHLVMAIDPAAFGSPADFASRLDAWVDSIKALPPAVDGGEVLVPGEPETRAEALHDRLVPVDVSVAEELEALAGSLGLERTWRALVAVSQPMSEPPTSGR